MTSQKSRDKAFLSLKLNNMFKCWLGKALFCVAASFSLDCRVHGSSVSKWDLWSTKDVPVGALVQ